MSDCHIKGHFHTSVLGHTVGGVIAGDSKQRLAVVYSNQLRDSMQLHDLSNY